MNIYERMEKENTAEHIKEVDELAMTTVEKE